MRRYWINIIIVMLLSNICLGQDSYTDDALKAYKEGDMSLAKELIVKALDIESNQNDPKVWNFKGHIYKQDYKNSGLNPNSTDRVEAVEAFMKSSEISKSSMYHKDNVKALDYFSATYFNDAIKGAANIRFNVDQDPVKYFQKFKEIKLWIDKDANITRQELEFLKLLAQGFEKLHYEGENEDEEFMLKAVGHYEQALAIDSMDYEANFNLAVVYYNEGADLISTIDYTTGFSELITIQKKCVMLFKKALPYMKRAEAIRPNRIETLKGLMFINRALNNFDEYLAYKVKLEEILKK